MFQPSLQASLRRKLQELKRKVPQCLLQLPRAALRAPAKRWLGAAFSFMPISMFPDVSGSSPLNSFQVLFLWLSFPVASPSSAFPQWATAALETKKNDILLIAFEISCPRSLSQRRSLAMSLARQLDSL